MNQDKFTHIIRDAFYNRYHRSIKEDMLNNVMSFVDNNRLEELSDIYDTMLMKILSAGDSKDSYNTKQAGKLVFHLLRTEQWAKNDQCIICGSTKLNDAYACEKHRLSKIYNLDKQESIAQENDVGF